MSVGDLYRDVSFNDIRQLNVNSLSTLVRLQEM